MKKIKLFKQAKTLYVLTGMFFAFSVSSAAQTIINGSFETPDATAGNAGLPGVLWQPANATWVFEGASSGIMKYGSAYAPPVVSDGIQCAAIQNGGNLYQNINFDAGTYVLTFSAAQRTGNADNIPIVVSVDGTTISMLTASSTANFSPLQTASFTVTAGVHKIQLTTTQTANDCTVFLDNVVISAASSFLTGTWDQRPTTSFSATYNQNFSSTWDTTFDAVFQRQWTTLGAFGAANVSTGALNYSWPAQRIIATKQLSIPYAITADIDYQNNSNRGGIVLRETSGNLENMQEPAFGDPGFNKEGIALYPSADGSSFVVQFNGVPVANTTGNTQAKVFVPAPASTILLARNTIKVEDYGSSVYVYYNGNPYIRIELGGKVGTKYTSGTVYDANMNVVGVFSGKVIESIGQAGIVQRDAVLRLYSVTIESTPTWTGGTSISWTDGTNWSTGIVPDQNSDVTIGTGTFQPTIATNVSINSLTINGGASLTVSGPNLTVTGVVANSGTMTLGSNSNLIQVNNGPNTGTGNTTVTRSSNPLYRLDYTMWSSPVYGAQTLAQFSPLTSQSPNNRFFTYDPSSNLYVNVSPSSTFATGTGYLIRMPNTDPTTDYDAGTATLTYNGAFIGTPNNGTVPLNSLTAGKYYSVGNPYPSTISADAFINGNSTDGTLYFWRKKNAAAGSAYATYNLVGVTVTAAGSGVAGEGSAAPNGTIQVGQGFIVKTASTSLSFTNAMRVANNQNQFFKTKQVQKDRVWLNLSRPATKMGTLDIPEVFSQALIGYVDGATLGVDNGIDGKYINDSETALTSSINEEEYTIQGRPAFDPTDVVALNFKNDADVVYTIALDHFDGVFATGQDIYLLDSKTGIETDLKAGSYTFAATAGVDNARFSLKYQKTLRVDAPTFNENSVRVYKNNGALYVNSGNVAISNIKVFDIQGRLLAEQKNVKATSAVISNLRASNQVLIVKIVGEDNSVVTKKVVN